MVSAKCARSLAIALAMLSCSPGAADVPQRSWTTRDSIAVRYFVSTWEYPGSLEATPPLVEWSKDRQHFFFVARHGDLSCDCNVYGLYVYAVADVRLALRGGAQAPQPRRRVTFSSSSSEVWFQGINEPRWETDSTILFLGVRGEGRRQAYRLDISSGALTQLTRSASDVRGYDVRGESLVYTTFHWTRRGALDAYPVAAIQSDDLTEVLDPRRNGAELFAVYRGQNTQSLGAVTWVQGGPWIAPDGKHAVIELVLEQFARPADWKNYEINLEKYFMNVGRFMLIDLENGRMQPVLDAPTGQATRAGWHSSPSVLWSPDSKRVLLVNTALPLEQQRNERRNTPYIVDLEVATGRWQVVDELFTPTLLAERNNESIRVATAAEWVRPGDRFALQITTQAPSLSRSFATRVYSRTGAEWIGREKSRAVSSETGASPNQSDLSVEIRQSANDPPMPVASYGGKQLPLLDADPALEGLARAQVRPVQWRENDGRTITGGLLLPPQRSDGTPPPLVIQAYNYYPHLFRPDGTSPTAYAAQPLVSAGFAVLFMDIPIQDPDRTWRDSVSGTVREGQAFVARIDAAVQQLAKEGLIDAARVGLIGFSRAGFMTYYAITHPSAVPLKAAVMADSYTGSYADFVNDAATEPVWNRVAAQHVSYYGGTFWEKKAEWLAEAPSFNVDRVVTPTLMSINGKDSNFFGFETLGAFRINRKPIEYLSFPSGTHQLQRPRERLASMDASVEWMSFWILGREDPAPEKAAQYARWRKMKDDWK